MILTTRWARSPDFEQIIAGIIDPTKVTRFDLENTASVYGMLLTNEYAITEVRSTEPAMSMGDGKPDMIQYIKSFYFYRVVLIIYFIFIKTIQQ